MHKDHLKNFLFDIINENNTIFINIALDDETDTIFVETVNREQFMVTVSNVTADHTYRAVGEEEPETDVSRSRGAEHEGFRRIYRGRDKPVSVCHS